MPLNTIPVLIVKHRQASLIIKLLEALNSEAALVLHIPQFSCFQSREVIRLSFSRLPLSTPECDFTWDVGWRYFPVAIRPEPSIDVDWLQFRCITTFVQEIALPSGCVDRANIVYKITRLKTGMFFLTYLCASSLRSVDTLLRFQMRQDPCTARDKNSFH